MFLWMMRITIIIELCIFRENRGTVNTQVRVYVRTILEVIRHKKRFRTTVAQRSTCKMYVTEIQMDLIALPLLWKILHNSQSNSCSKGVRYWIIDTTKCAKV